MMGSFEEENLEEAGASEGWEAIQPVAVRSSMVQKSQYT